MKPSSATDRAVDTCAISMVGRRPSRSVSTPATSEEITPPSPCRAATSPAYEAECPRSSVRYSAMKVATNPPSRLTSVLVHSHQNSRGNPETLRRTAVRTARGRSADGDGKDGTGMIATPLRCTGT